MNTELSIATSLNPPRAETASVRKPAAAQELSVVTGQSLPAADSARQTPAVEEEQRVGPEAAPQDTDKLQQAVTRMNDFVQTLQRDLQFEIDDDLGRTVISVVDSETKEVIRQIPPETVLERARRLDAEQDAAGGLLFREQA